MFERRIGMRRPFGRFLRGTPGLLLFATLAVACGDRVTAPPEEPPEEALDFAPTALPTVTGAPSHAHAVDEAGRVVGWENVQGGRAVVHDAAGNPTLLLGIWSSALGVNAGGTIVGWSLSPTSGRQGGYAWVNGQHRLLPPLLPDHHSPGWTINADHIVAGVSNGWAVVWEPKPDGSYGAPRDLGLHRLSNSDGAHINNRGDVAFTAQGDQCCRAVLWRRQADGSYADALTLGQAHSGPHYARGINDAGIVVGYRWSGTEEIAVAWLPSNYSQPLDLGPGQAWEVNNHNQVVGTSGGELAGFNLNYVESRPALWILNPNGSVTGPLDLGTPPGFESSAARHISDSGWIAGSSWGPGAGPGVPVVATRWRLPASLRVGSP